MAARIVTSSQDIGATAEALTHAADGALTIHLKADPANTGIIYIGDSTVSAATGYPLSPGDTFPFTLQSLDGVYAIAAVADEDLIVLTEHLE